MSDQEQQAAQTAQEGQTAPEQANPQAEAAQSPQTPPKRRRGRPSNAERAARTGKPAEQTVPPSSSSTPPKKKPRTSSADATAALAQQVQGLHQLAALALGIPELQIAPNEAQLLAGALDNVAQQYGLELGGKSGAVLQLAAACAAIYVPRFLHVKARADAARQQARAEAAQAQARAAGVVAIGPDGQPVHAAP